MDIHPPTGPTHSLREFSIHIAVVTVGILIALSLEGIRETWREHTLATEARENFRDEAEGNRKNLAQELANVRDMKARIQSILKDMPVLRAHPEQFADRIQVIQPSLYFFSNARWQSALSTGALGHMQPAEVDRYSSENLLVQAYGSIEHDFMPVYVSVLSYFVSRTQITPAEIAGGIEKLLTLQFYVQGMNHVAEQLEASINDVLAPH